MQRSTRPSGRKAHSLACENLHVQAGVPIQAGVPYGRDHLQLFQDVIPDFKIKVWELTMPLQQPRLIFSGRSEAEKTIHLLFSEDHYDVVCNVAAFFGYNFYYDCCSSFWNMQDRAENRIYPRVGFVDGGEAELCKVQHGLVTPHY